MLGELRPMSVLHHKPKMTVHSTHNCPTMTISGCTPLTGRTTATSVQVHHPNSCLPYNILFIETELYSIRNTASEEVGCKCRHTPGLGSVFKSIKIVEKWEK